MPLDRPIVAYTGHVNATKGIETIVSLAEGVPEALFLLVGHDGKGGLSHLGNPDRSDLDGLLRVHHEPVAGDSYEQGEHERVEPSPAAQAKHISVGDRQREHGKSRDRAYRRHERGDIHVLPEVAR